MSPLVLGEILGVFLNTLTSDGKYHVQGCENLQLKFQCNYLKNKNIFSNFVPFLESTSNFEHFEKKMILIANVLPNLETVKILLKPLFKKRRFRTPFDSQHVKASQMLSTSS